MVCVFSNLIGVTRKIAGRQEMRLRRLVLSILVITSVVLLQSGSGSQAFGADEPAAGGAKPEEAPAAGAGTAKIVFEKTIQDFGRIAPGAKNVCEFKFCNKGDGVLKITNVSKTCGCTPFTLEKKNYAPGECGTLKVKYNADKGHGSRARKLYVYSNDPANKKVQLTIKAVIVQKVEYEPTKLKYTLKGEKAGVAELTVRSIDNKPFSIKGFTSTGNQIIAEYDASQEATEIAVRTKINPDKADRNVNGRIEVRLTHPECPKVTVPYSILPRFQITPPSINVLNAKPAQATEKEVWILNNYDEDFEVESTSAKSGLIKVVSQEKVGKRYKLILEITPPPTKSRARIFTDTLYVRLKDGGKLEVPCRGFYARKGARTSRR